MRSALNFTSNGVSSASPVLMLYLSVGCVILYVDHTEKLKTYLAPIIVDRNKLSEEIVSVLRPT